MILQLAGRCALAVRTTARLPFTIHHSPFTIHHSPFTIPAHLAAGALSLAYFWFHGVGRMLPGIEEQE